MGDEAKAALLYLATHPGSTTSEVGKAVFGPENDRELRNADRRVRYYFTDKYPYLIDRVNDESPATYEVDDDRVFAGLARLEVETFDDEELSIGLGGTVVYVDDDGDLNIEPVGAVEAEAVDEASIEAER